MPCVELDAIFHQPGWQLRPAAEFLAEVDRSTSGDGWVVDGNYRAVVREGPVWQRADTVVWLDLPKHLALRQVAWRSLRRAATREELWNGNRERWRELLSLDPMRSMPAYVWTYYDRKRAQVEAARADPALAHLEFVHLRSHAESAAWLATLRNGPSEGPAAPS
ncbi:MAG: hypothetical protein R2702_14385 [Acidimicrobiales bacterium]